MKPHIGAHFFKADFHIHTPASQDVKVGAFSPEEVVAAAIAAGLDIIAVTDHNSADWIDLVRDAAAGTSLTIIPGTEITTPEGHFLALFEKDFSASRIADLLIAIGIDRDHHGKEDAISKMHAEEVIPRVEELGGITIAAHANSSNGLMKEAKGRYKMATFPLSGLLALELGKEDEIAKFTKGTVSSDYPPKACTQSSDAHQLADIGNRFTYLKMDEPSLYGIRQALLDHRVRTRFEWDMTESAHPRIVGMSVDQGFFKGEVFDFHSGLNCLIGGKGTGKSTVIELLRYAFEDVSEFKSIESDNIGKIKTLVGDGGCITVNYMDSDGVLKIVKREVQAWATPSEVRDENGNATEVFAPPTFFSQGELVQIASDNLAQMDLLDQRIDTESEDDAEDEAIDALNQNANDIDACDRRKLSLQAEIDDPKRGRVVTEAAFRDYEKQLKEPIFKELPAWEAEQAYLSSLEETTEALADEFIDAIDSVDIEALSNSLPGDAPNAKTLEALEDIESSIQTSIEAAKKLVEVAIRDAQKLILKSKTSIEPRYSAKKQAYAEALEKVGADDIKKATEQFASLGRRLEAIRGHEEDLDREVRRFDRLHTARKTQLSKLSKARKTRLTKRRSKASEYQTLLEGIITVNVIENGDRTDFDHKLKELATGSRAKDVDITAVAESMHPNDLLKAVLTDDSQTISDTCSISVDVANRLITGLKAHTLEDLLSIETVDLTDVPEISYVVHGGRSKPLSELSTGQKGTVILSLAMVEETGPLIVDQPEEPLDTESIYTQVVTTLRNSKDARQFIFTTHNANVAVGADADLSHVLKATADKGTIESSGAVDHIATNKLLLVHLEGGKDALARRIQKYRPS